ncbi:MAG: hypothetical protein WCI72_04125 [archaeon]
MADEQNNHKRKGVYETIDSGIMYGVNKGVQAWNWTTGRTKFELANGLLMGYTVLYSAKSLVNEKSTNLDHLGAACFALLLGQMYSSWYRKNDKLEVQAMEKSLKDLKVESDKKMLGFVGALNGRYTLASEPRTVHKDLGQIDYNSMKLSSPLQFRVQLPSMYGSVPRNAFEAIRKDYSSRIVESDLLVPWEDK